MSLKGLVKAIIQYQINREPSELTIIDMYKKQIKYDLISAFEMSKPLKDKFPDIFNKSSSFVNFLFIINEIDRFNFENVSSPGTLPENIADSTIAFQTINDKLLQCQEEISLLKEKKTNCETKINEKDKLIRELEIRTEDYKKKFEACEDTIKKLNSSSGQQSKDLTGMTELMLKYEKEENTLKTENENFKRLIDEKEGQIADLQMKLTQCHEKNEKMATEIDELKTDLKKYMSDLKECRDQNEIDKNRTEREIAKFQTKNSELESENQQMKDTIAKFQTKNSELESENQQMKDTIAKFQTNNSKLESENQQMKDTITKNDTETIHLKKENLDLKQKFSELFSEHTLCKQQYETLQNESENNMAIEYSSSAPQSLVQAHSNLPIDNVHHSNQNPTVQVLINPLPSSINYITPHDDRISSLPHTSPNPEMNVNSSLSVYSPQTELSVVNQTPYFNAQFSPLVNDQPSNLTTQYFSEPLPSSNIPIASYTQSNSQFAIEDCTLQSKLDDCEAKLSEQKLEYEGKIGRLNIQLNELKNKMDNLEQQNQQLNEQLVNLTKENNELKTNSVDYMHNINRLQIDLKLKENDISALMQDIEKITRDKQILTETNENLRDLSDRQVIQKNDESANLIEIERLKENSVKSNADMQTLREEKINLNIKILDLQKQIDHLNTQINKKTQTDAIDSNLQIKNKKKRSRTVSIDDESEKLSQITENLNTAELANENEKLKGSLSLLEEKMKTLTNTHEQKIKSLLEESGILKSNTEDDRQAFDSLQEQFDICKKKLKETKLRLDKYKEIFDGLDIELYTPSKYNFAKRRKTSFKPRKRVLKSSDKKSESFKVSQATNPNDLMDSQDINEYYEDTNFGAYIYPENESARRMADSEFQLSSSSDDDRLELTPFSQRKIYAEFSNEQTIQFTDANFKLLFIAFFEYHFKKLHFKPTNLEEEEKKLLNDLMKLLKDIQATDNKHFTDVLYFYVERQISSLSGLPVAAEYFDDMTNINNLLIFAMNQTETFIKNLIAEEEFRKYLERNFGKKLNTTDPEFMNHIVKIMKNLTGIFKTSDILQLEKYVTDIFHKIILVHSKFNKTEEHVELNEFIIYLLNSLNEKLDLQKKTESNLINV